MRLFPVHESTADEAFMVRALGILTRPGKAARTFGLVANGIFYLACTGFLGFLAAQAWDRSQPPVTFLRAWADPRQVVAGTPVRQWVEVIRHKRCSYATSWSVTDARSMVSYFGPVYQVAPGPAGPEPQPPFGIEFATSPVMSPGPATLRVTLRGNCPGNYLDDWFPVEISVPEIAFDVVAPPHDLAPGAHP